MSALHRFEQRLEALVTGAFARAFRSAVQPVEIASALQREVENSAQILSRQRRLAPNIFEIELSTTDFDRLSAYGETMSRELATMLQDYAEEQGYVFAGPLHLDFQRVEDLTTGRFHVRSHAAANVPTASDQRGSDQRGPDQRGPDHRNSEQQGSSPPPRTAHRLSLEVNGTRHPLHEPGLIVGRGSEADLRVDDPGVSRRHAEFRVQPAGDTVMVSVVDLGSTNGTLIGGRRVDHAVLSDGTTVQVGRTKIKLHIRPGVAAEPTGRGG